MVRDKQTRKLSEGRRRKLSNNIKLVLEARVSKVNTGLLNFLRKKKSQEMQFQIQKHLASLAERSMFMYHRNRKRKGRRRKERIREGEHRVNAQGRPNSISTTLVKNGLCVRLC